MNYLIFLHKLNFIYRIFQVVIDEKGLTKKYQRVGPTHSDSRESGEHNRGHCNQYPLGIQHLDMN